MVYNLERTLREELQKTRAEGVKEGIINTAKNLINLGISEENIAKATGLSIEEVQSLKEKAN